MSEVSNCARLLALFTIRPKQRFCILKGLVDGVAEGEEYNMFCYFGHVTPSQAVGNSTNADICGEQRVSSYTLVVKWYSSANMYLLVSEMKLRFVREILASIVIRAVAWFVFIHSHL